jgi:hypothetical protein
MIKNKKPLLISATKNKITIFMALLVSLLVVSVVPAYAAPAGCYVSAGGITKYTCPTEDYRTGVNQGGLCYVFAGGNGPVSDNGVQTDCEKITVGSNGNSSDDSSPGETGVDVKEASFNDQDCSNPQLDSGNCRIIEYLVAGINVLSALAGMVIIFSIMFAGFQYMTAQDNSGQIQQARQRIIWAITAMLIFIFMYAMLDFLIPGGVL